MISISSGTGYVGKRLRFSGVDSLIVSTTNFAKSIMCQGWGECGGVEAGNTLLV